MPLDLKSAVSKLQKGGPGLSLPFFYCEADAKGKPVVLAGPVKPDEKAKALAGARSKKTAEGKMSLTDDGDLHLKAKGPALSSLKKGMEAAVKAAGAGAVVSSVILGAADPADDSDSSDDSSTTQAPARPTTPAPSGPPKPATLAPKTTAATGAAKPATWAAARGAAPSSKGATTGGGHRAAPPTKLPSADAYNAVRPSPAPKPAPTGYDSFANDPLRNPGADGYSPVLPGAKGAAPKPVAKGPGASNDPLRNPGADGYSPVLPGAKGAAPKPSAKGPGASNDPLRNPGADGYSPVLPGAKGAAPKPAAKGPGATDDPLRNPGADGYNPVQPGAKGAAPKPAAKGPGATTDPLRDLDAAADSYNAVRPTGKPAPKSPGSAYDPLREPGVTADGYSPVLSGAKGAAPQPAPKGPGATDDPLRGPAARKGAPPSTAYDPVFQSGDELKAAEDAVAARKAADAAMLAKNDATTRGRRDARAANMPSNAVVPPPQAAPPPGKKQFLDPLRRSPELGKLLDERKALRARMEEEAMKADGDPAALEAMAAELEAKEEAMEAAQKKLNATGMSPAPMHPEYAGEDKKVGWAGGPPPRQPAYDRTKAADWNAANQKKYQAALASWKALVQSEISVRKNFSEKEKAASEMKQGVGFQDGIFVDKKGKPMNTGDSTEYVLDPETGKMHDFVATPVTMKKKVVDPASGEKVAQAGRVHHSSVLSGKEVGGAGAIEVEHGKVKYVDNLSGHYKPNVGALIQTVEALTKMGALLDKNWTDKDGGAVMGKAFDLLNSIRSLQRRVADRLKKNPEMDVKVDKANIEKALKMLHKMGYGPSNRMRPDAKVGALDSKKNLNGLAVKNAKEDAHKGAMPAEEFLRTGGGNMKAAAAKATVLEDLKAKTAATRQKLDDAAVEGEGAAMTTEEEVDAAQKTLNQNERGLRKARDGVRTRAAKPMPTNIKGNTPLGKGEMNYAEVEVDPDGGF